jgi:membrane associated rhomboid family serine protease
MSDSGNHRKSAAPSREPAILLPPVVLVLAGLMVAIHLGFSFVLSESAQQDFLLWFAFIPLRIVQPGEILGGALPLLWTPVTHAFLHANLEHLLINTAWLVIFATPCARRYGAWPVIVIFLVTAVVGAATFAVGEIGHVSLLIGASGGVAGLTGAATRFMFQPVLVHRDEQTGEPIVLGRRLSTLAEVFTNTRARVFTLVFLGANLAIGLLPLVLGEQGGLAIAWEAHVGGFVAGLLMVPLFERRGGVGPQ